MANSSSLLVELPGGTLEVVVFGETGPLIIFCHGFPGSYKHEDLATAIADSGGTVWLMKYRGVDNSSGEFSFMNAIEDVEALIRRAQKIGYDKVGLFGYSAGAYYALNAAVRTQGVSAICLLSPVADMIRAARSGFENIVDLMVHSTKVIRLASFAELVASYAEVWRERNVLEIVKDLAGVPLLIIEGGDSERGDPKQAELLLEAAGEPKQLRILQAAGHYFDDFQSRNLLKEWLTEFFLHKIPFEQHIWRAGSITFKFFPYADLLPQEVRLSLAADLDEVADEVWNKDTEYWRKNDQLFTQAYGIAVAHSIKSGDAVGFLVYKRILIGSSIFLYVEGINFKPAYQHRGHFLHLCEKALEKERAEADGRSLYFVARTRNPGVLSIMQKFCVSIVPARNASALVLSEAENIAGFLFPNAEIDFPSMIMHNVYSQFSYKHDPAQKEQKGEVQHIFQGLGPHDAFFLVGEVSPLDAIKAE